MQSSSGSMLTLTCCQRSQSTSKTLMLPLGSPESAGPLGGPLSMLRDFRTVTARFKRTQTPRAGRSLVHSLHGPGNQPDVR